MLLYTLGDHKGRVIIQCGTDEFPLYSLGCYVLRGPSATPFVSFLTAPAALLPAFLVLALPLFLDHSR